MPEFDHITWLRKNLPTTNSSVIKSIGDDCAVIDLGDKYQIVTADMLVDGDHFKLEWSTPQQIGMKCMEVSISDIAAMGGVPTFAFVSICLTGKEPEGFIEALYEGMKRSCDLDQSLVNSHWLLASNKNDLMTNDQSPMTKRHNYNNNFQNQKKTINIIGGDITHGATTVINVTLMGEVAKEDCILRSSAQEGDIICVTGNLGGSWAGLEYLWKHGIPNDISQTDTFIQYCLKKHLEPKSRLEAGQILKNYATAMIDVSDGLGSEVRHIAKESGVGAIVYEDKIPLADEVKQMADFLDISPYKWALSGGEDFELVFTIPPEKETELKDLLDFFVVGTVKNQQSGIKLIKKDGSEIELPGGYEHEV